MLAGLFEIRETENKGNGLFAKRFIPKGTIVWFECKKCRRMGREEFGALSKKEQDFILDHGYPEGNVIMMSCDDVIYWNHSCNANVLESGKGFDIVVRGIKKGEEATYDYRALNQNKIWGKRFTYTTMECKCGESNCCKILKIRSRIPKELKTFWGKKAKSALKMTKKVPQPLKGQLIKSSEKYRKYF